jgi:hypothetical protein
MKRQRCILFSNVDTVNALDGPGSEINPWVSEVYQGQSYQIAITAALYDMQEPRGPAMQRMQAG